MNQTQKVATIAALSIIPTLAHYITDIHNGPAHDIYQRVYYLPVILAALWFGVRGGLTTAVLVAIAYFPHAIHGWHGPYSAFYRFMEVAMYLVVGWLTGWLTDRLRTASEAERHARDEAERAYASLKFKTDELFALEEQLRRADRLAALGQLSAGLAHEIRNPLASIKTSVEILRSKVQPSQRSADEPDFAGIILEETARLDLILTEFLQFARTEQARPADEPNESNVLEALQKVLDLTDADLKLRRISAVVQAEGLNHGVSFCESHLRQVFLNLLLNSIEAMPTGGEFRVYAERQESGFLLIAVEDTGPGIPAEIAEKVFDPFFSTKEKGTGLGLSIVERILDTHGGSITLGNVTPASASRFLLRLPLQQT